MKKELSIEINNNELNAFIHNTKVAMVDMEENNKGVFGDEYKCKQAKAFNELEEFEKNILCIYTYCGSYMAMESYMNIKKSAIANEITRIKKKMING